MHFVNNAARVCLTTLLVIIGLASLCAAYENKYEDYCGIVKTWPNGANNIGSTGIKSEAGHKAWVMVLGDAPDQIRLTGSIFGNGSGLMAVKTIANGIKTLYTAIVHIGPPVNKDYYFTVTSTGTNTTGTCVFGNGYLPNPLAATTVTYWA
jgi:hypothetical protein